LNDKIKNIFKITLFSGIILGTTVLLNDSENKKEETTIHSSNYENQNSPKISSLTPEIVKIFG
jgi:hypothetical protein